MLKVMWPGSNFELVDFIPMEWFQSAGSLGAHAHYINGINGRKSTTGYCDLVVSATEAMLDYGNMHEEANAKNDVDIGVSKFIFFDVDRTGVKSIYWKRKGSSRFENEGTRFHLEDDDLALIEGGPKLVQHVRAERRPELARRKKEIMLANKGHLECEACTADLRLSYGESTLACYEAHHDGIALAERGSGLVTLDDLAILCANCHRAIHRTKPMVTVKAFREALEKISPSKNSN